MIAIFAEEDVKGAVTDMVIKIMDTDPAAHGEACAALEAVFKDLGENIHDIKGGKTKVLYSIFYM